MGMKAVAYIALGLGVLFGTWYGDSQLDFPLVLDCIAYFTGGLVLFAGFDAL